VSNSPTQSRVNYSFDVMFYDALHASTQHSMYVAFPVVKVSERAQSMLYKYSYYDTKTA